MATPAAAAGSLAGRRLARWQAPSRESRDTLFMLALIGWTIAPHLGHLPAWIGLLAYGVLAWRARLAWRQAPLPGRGTVIGLLGVAAALTYWSEHALVGKEAGVTLLVVLMALKTLELRARRDAMVVFFLGFFLVLTTFLYSQSFATAVMAAIAVWGWLAALALAHMPAGRPPLRVALGQAGRAALVGTPVMIALFLLFPRIGPLWNAPNDTGTTGLSDEMELGSVAELASDDTSAFRVRFDGGMRLPPSALYFRGPVLVDTDGHAWHARSVYDVRRGAPPAGRLRFGAHATPVRYEMALEPSHQSWLAMLDLTPPALPGETDAGAGVTSLGGDDVTPLPDVAGQWRTRRPIAVRARLAATAWPGAGIATASPAELLADVALPPGAHARTRAWAAQWRAAHGGDAATPEALVQGLYAYIRTAGFSYTLSPGTYEADPVDEFWLDRRSGFCEHFASAFTVVLRAMGVPARIVTGYQGTDAAPQDDWWIVRQANAHAWVEYWSPGTGWRRADPTAAVAPDRIQRGRTVRPPPGLVASAFDAVSPDLLDRLRQWRELLDNRWDDWVLGYDRHSQFGLLRQLGVKTPDADDLGRAMIAVIVAASLAGAVAAALDARRRTSGQRLARRLAHALAPLAPHGIDAPPHASAGTLARAIRERFGRDGEAIASRLDDLERRRYGPAGTSPPTSDHWRTLRDAARTLAARAAAPERAPRRSARATAG